MFAKDTVNKHHNFLIVLIGQPKSQRIIHEAVSPETQMTCLADRKKKYDTNKYTNKMILALENISNF